MSEHLTSSSSPDMMLTSYLEWVIQSQQFIQLPGLSTGPCAIKVELDRVFMALRVNWTSPARLQWARQLLHRQVAEADAAAGEGGQPVIQETLEQETVAQDPYLGADPQSSTSSPRITAGEALKNHRCLVVLGDPGCGKTTLAQWISLHSAKALLNHNDLLDVPCYQYDPSEPDSRLLESSVGEHKVKTNCLGPTRLPVLVQVKEWVNKLVEGHQSANSLFKYLSISTWNGGNCDANPEALLDLFSKWLGAGRLLVIIDGLDEVSLSEQRLRIKQLVEDFILRYVLNFNPSQDIGNQVIITSRVAGYHVNPLDVAGVVHVLIEPMSLQVIDRFCETWMAAVEENSAKQLTQQMKRMVRSSPRTLQLARTPLLLSIIGMILRDPERKADLPDNRASLYQVVLRYLLNIWLEAETNHHGLGFDQLMTVMKQVAVFIHMHSSNRLISSSELHSLLMQHLPAASANTFMKVLPSKVALLAEKGRGMYGFLHLTMQEFLLGLWLLDAICRSNEQISKAAAACTEILAHLSHPHWWEPIQLALAFASKDWLADDFNNLCLFLLAHDGNVSIDEPSSVVMPIGAILLGVAMPELTRVPEPPVLTELINSLFDCYTWHLEHVQSSGVQYLVESAFAEIHQRESQFVEEALLYGLTNHDSGAKTRACAQLIHRNGWTNMAWLGSPLVDALSQDRGPAWPIHTALRTVRGMHLQLSLVNTLSFSQEITTNRNLLSRISSQSDSDLLLFLEHNREWQVSLLSLAGVFLSESPLERLISDFRRVYQLEENRDRLGRETKKKMVALIDAFSNSSQHTVVELLCRDPCGWRELVPLLRSQRLCSEKVLRNAFPSLIVPDRFRLLVGIGAAFEIDVFEEVSNFTTSLLPTERSVMRHDLESFRYELKNMVNSVSVQLLKLFVEKPPALPDAQITAALDTILAVTVRSGCFHLDPLRVVPLRVKNTLKPLLLAYHFASILSEDDDVNDVLFEKFSTRYANIELLDSLGHAFTIVSPRRAEIVPRSNILAFGSVLDNLVQCNSLVVMKMLRILDPLIQNEPLSLFSSEVSLLNWLYSTTSSSGSFDREELLDSQSSRIQALPPFYRARIQLRLALYLNSNISFVRLALASAQFESNPLNQMMALELIWDLSHHLLDPSDLPQMIETMVAATMKLGDDPVNKARALSRLYMRVPSIETKETIEQDICGAIVTISDISVKIQTLVAVCDHLGPLPIVQRLFSKVSNSEIPNWVRAACNGRYGPKFVALTANILLQFAKHPQIGKINLAWSVMSILTTLDDLNRPPIAAPNKDDDLWQALQGDHSQETLSALEKLRHLGRQYEGVKLTDTAARTIIATFKTDQIIACEMLSFVRPSDVTIVNALRQQLSISDCRPEIQVFSAVLAAEAGVIEPETIPLLKVALESQDDILRMRAYQAICGDTKRRVLTSRLGLDTLRSIGKIICDASWAPFIRETFVNFLFFIVSWDDVATVQNLVNEYESLESATSEPEIQLRRAASRVLSLIRRPSISVYRELLHLLQSSHLNQIRCVILTALSIMISENSVLRLAPDTPVDEIMRSILNDAQSATETKIAAIKCLCALLTSRFDDFAELSNILEDSDASLEKSVVDQLGSTAFLKYSSVYTWKIRASQLVADEYPPGLPPSTGKLHLVEEILMQRLALESRVEIVSVLVGNLARIRCARWIAEGMPTKDVYVRVATDMLQSLISRTKQPDEMFVDAWCAALDFYLIPPLMWRNLAECCGQFGLQRGRSFFQALMRRLRQELSIRFTDCPPDCEAGKCQHYHTRTALLWAGGSICSREVHDIGDISALVNLLYGAIELSNNWRGTIGALRILAGMRQIVGERGLNAWMLMLNRSPLEREAALDVADCIAIPHSIGISSKDQILQRLISEFEKRLRENSSIQTAVCAFALGRLARSSKISRKIQQQLLSALKNSAFSSAQSGLDKLVYIHHEAELNHWKSYVRPFCQLSEVILNILIDIALPDRGLAATTISMGIPHLSNDRKVATARSFEALSGEELLDFDRWRDLLITRGAISATDIPSNDLELLQTRLDEYSLFAENDGNPCSIFEAVAFHLYGSMDAATQVTTLSVGWLRSHTEGRPFSKEDEQQFFTKIEAGASLDPMSIRGIANAYSRRLIIVTAVRGIRSIVVIDPVANENSLGSPPVILCHYGAQWYGSTWPASSASRAVYRLVGASLQDYPKIVTEIIKLDSAEISIASFDALKRVMGERRRRVLSLISAVNKKEISAERSTITLFSKCCPSAQKILLSLLDHPSIITEPLNLGFNEDLMLQHCIHNALFHTARPSQWEKRVRRLLLGQTGFDPSSAESILKDVLGILEIASLAFSRYPNFTDRPTPPDVVTTVVGGAIHAANLVMQCQLALSIRCVKLYQQMIEQVTELRQRCEVSQILLSNGTLESLLGALNTSPIDRCKLLQLSWLDKQTDDRVIFASAAAIASIKTKRWEDVAAALDICIMTQSDWRLALYWRGVAHMNHEEPRLDLAVADFTRAMDLMRDPESAWRRAVCNQRRGRLAEACIDYGYLMLFGFRDLANQHLAELLKTVNITPTGNKWLKPLVRGFGLLYNQFSGSPSLEDMHLARRKFSKSERLAPAEWQDVAQMAHFFTYASSKSIEELLEQKSNLKWFHTEFLSKRLSLKETYAIRTDDAFTVKGNVFDSLVDDDDAIRAFTFAFERGSSADRIDKIEWSVPGDASNLARQLWFRAIRRAATADLNGSLEDVISAIELPSGYSIRSALTSVDLTRLDDIELWWQALDKILTAVGVVFTLDGTSISLRPTIKRLGKLETGIPQLLDLLIGRTSISTHIGRFRISNSALKSPIHSGWLLWIGMAERLFGLINPVCLEIRLGPVFVKLDSLTSELPASSFLAQHGTPTISSNITVVPKSPIDLTPSLSGSSSNSNELTSSHLLPNQQKTPSHLSPAPPSPFSSTSLSFFSQHKPGNTAHSQIQRAALEFNQQAKAPRTGINAVDPGLWGFSAGIQASDDVIRYLESRFELIKPQLVDIFEETFKELPSGDFPFEFKPEFAQGGSVANKTFLTSPDLDMLLVINSTRGLKAARIAGGELQYSGLSTTVVNAAMVTLISSACADAIDQFLAVQDGTALIKPAYFSSNGMTVFTLQEEKENYAGLRLEFDVVPVLKVIGNKYLLLDKTNGKLVPSSTQFAAHTIGVHAKDCPGLREMMVVLKLAHNAGIKQGLSSLEKVPSCALEMVVLLLAEDKSRDSAKWWRESSFTIIFRAAITQLLGRLSSGTRLPAPNDPSDDVLRGIRGNTGEFVDYYTHWQGIHEAALLDELKACFDRVRSTVYPVASSPNNHPTSSSSEIGQVGSSTDYGPRSSEPRSQAGSSFSSGSGLSRPYLSEHKFSRKLVVINRDHAPDPENIQRALKMLIKSNVPSRFCTDLVAAVEYIVDRRPKTTIQELAECFELIPGCAALSRDLKSLFRFSLK